MSVKKYYCKYCGTPYKTTICHNCKEKLKLVRELLKMVRNKAEEVGYFENKKVTNKK